MFSKSIIEGSSLSLDARLHSGSSSMSELSVSLSYALPPGRSPPVASVLTHVREPCGAPLHGERVLHGAPKHAPDHAPFAALHNGPPHTSEVGPSANEVPVGGKVPSDAASLQRSLLMR